MMPPDHAIALLLCLAPPGPEVVVDGRFDDWTDVAPAVADPPDDAPHSPVDLGTVFVHHDAEAVYFLLETGRTGNLQALAGTLRLFLDADGDGTTGDDAGGLAGTDVIIELSPRGADGRVRPGVAVRPVGGGPLAPAVAGLVFAPTHAARRFELRLQRDADVPGAASFLTSATFAARAEFRTAGGDLADGTASFRYALRPTPPRAPRDRGDPLRRPPGTQLRVVTWNVGDGGPWRRPRPAARILRALAPDVVLLQEIPDARSATDVAAFLREATGDAAWDAIVGAGGRDLRCAVAARRPLEPIPALTLLPYPDLPQRSIRVSGAAVTVGARTLLAVSVHLRCCGSAGSFEDRTRQVEADAVRRALARSVSAAGDAAVVLGGDLNLVGSRRPLELLGEGLDADGSALDAVNALQLDGVSNTTWFDPRAPFPPGRLDFLLLPDSLRVLRSFVLETADLPSRRLQRHGLQADDSTVSDHRPIVADLRWAGAGP